jgi:hypothetical protein
MPEKLTSAKEAFLNTIPNGNVEWVAQQIILHTEDDEEKLSQIKVSFELLSKILFKSWAKQMTFTELKDALDIMSSFEPQSDLEIFLKNTP